jgi:hypothetical protein
MSNHHESKLQISCVNWFRYMYPQYGKLLFAVPNGGLRSVSTAKILKAEGVVAGVSDLLFMVARKGYHGLCIEVKIHPNKQTDSQMAWQKLVEKQGYQYKVVYNFEDFQNEMYVYLEENV